MNTHVCAAVAEAILIAWATAYLIPTRAVAASFVSIPLDNRRILVTEWMAEGITHISIGHPATTSHRAMPVARRASSVLSAC